MAWMPCDPDMEPENERECNISGIIPSKCKDESKRSCKGCPFKEVDKT